jgi:hypothetical protein
MQSDIVDARPSAGQCGRTAAELRTGPAVSRRAILNHDLRSKKVGTSVAHLDWMLSNSTLTVVGIGDGMPVVAPQVPLFGCYRLEPAAHSQTVK